MYNTGGPLTTPSKSYSLQVDHLVQTTGPLALVVPQAVQALLANRGRVKIIDHNGNAATLDLAGGQVVAKWDQPNELFPVRHGPPPWVARLDWLVEHLDLA